MKRAAGPQETQGRIPAMIRFLQKSAWIFAVLFLVGAILAFLFPGRHLLFGKIPLHLEAFEKALVMAGMLFGLGWFLKRREVRTPEADAKWAWAFAALFVVWFVFYNGFKNYFYALGMDIGIYTNTLWNTMHGAFMYESHDRANFFGEHFIPLSLPAAPLLLLWKSSTVLIIYQSLIVSLSIPALYFLALRKIGDTRIAFLFTLLFLISPYLHKIMTDPYRPITLAIPMFLWALYHLEAGRKWAFFLLMCLAFFVQESTPIFIGSVALYLFLFRPGHRILGLSLGVLSAAVFYFLLAVAMPHFYGKARLLHMDSFWSVFAGQGLAEIAWNILKNPLPILLKILEPQKVGQILFFTSTVFFLCWGSYKYLVVFLVPMIFIQLSDFMYMQHFSHHYSSESLVGVFYAAISVVGERKSFIQNVLSSVRWSRVLRWPALVLILAMISQIPSYQFLPNMEKVREFHSFVKEIPDEASVALSEWTFFGHLAFRKEVCRLPETRGYRYLIMLPEDRERYRDTLDPLLAKGDYVLKRGGKYTLLYEKKS